MAYFIPQPTAFSTMVNYNSFPGVSGYHLDFLSSTQMFLNPGYARAMNNDFSIIYPGTSANTSGSILLDITKVGPGGCFPFAMPDLSLTNDTVYGIYVIAKSSGTSNGTDTPLVSAIIATGDNFLPSGYDSFRRVGLCYISSSTNELIKWIQSGVTNERQYNLQDAVPALLGGSAIVPTVIDLTDGDGVLLPGHANYAQLGLGLVASAPNQQLFIEPAVLTATVLPAIGISSPAAGVMAANTEVVCGIIGPVTEHGNSAIKYYVSDAAAVANIYVSGFTDSLGNDLF